MWSAGHLGWLRCGGQLLKCRARDGVVSAQPFVVPARGCERVPELQESFDKLMDSQGASALPTTCRLGKKWWLRLTPCRTVLTCQLCSAGWPLASWCQLMRIQQSVSPARTVRQAAQQQQQRMQRRQQTGQRRRQRWQRRGPTLPGAPAGACAGVSSSTASCGSTVPTHWTALTLPPALQCCRWVAGCWKGVRWPLQPPVS